jgi:ADP-heptose:LPS heptosyltransferase
MENILVIRLKSIGDVLLTLPAVQAVRENFPAAKISFLTSIENVPLLRGFSEVNETIALDRPALRSGHPAKTCREFFGLLIRLRAGKFSLVVDLQGYGETAWLARITGAPHRWGWIYRQSRSWAYTRPVEPLPKVHPAETHLRLLQACGLSVGSVRNEFILPAAAVNDARAWLAGHRLEATKPTIYFQPFTSEARKNWPFKNYLALAGHWHARGVQIIVGGGPADQPLLDQARNLGFAVPTGLSRLTDAGLMKLSTLVVGGDTGFLHLAVAMGKRVIMLMSSQNPGHAVPFQHPEWAVVPQSGSRLEEVTLEKMIAATSAALAAATIEFK